MVSSQLGWPRSRMAPTAVGLSLCQTPIDVATPLHRVFELKRIRQRTLFYLGVFLIIRAFVVAGPADWPSVKLMHPPGLFTSQLPHRLPRPKWAGLAAPGLLMLVSHPGRAYRDLWRIAVALVLKCRVISGTVCYVCGCYCGRLCSR